MRSLILGPILIVLAGCSSQPPVVTEPTPEQVEQAKQVGYDFINTKDLADLIHQRSNMILIDARPEPVFRKGHILGATPFLFPDRIDADSWKEATHGGPSPETYARQLGPDKEIPIIVYADNAQSHRSHQAALWAKQLGYKKVSRFVGGLAAWIDAGEETRSLTETP